MGLYKRGQVWHMSFVYKGKRCRKSTETEDKKLAQRILDKVKGEIAENRWFEKLPGDDKTFREMMEKYLIEHVSRKSSAKTYRSHVRRFISLFGDRLLKEINPKLINEYKNKRREVGIKPASINRELMTVKKAFNLAVKEWEWLKENPIANVSMEQVDDKRDRWLTIDEERILLEGYPKWLREIVFFTLNTGMRRGEVLSLTWKALDLTRKTVTVFKSKNNEKRTIPLNDGAFELLKAKSKVRSIQTDIVFYKKNHAPISKSSLDREFHKALKKSGIEDFRWHDLRHTFATRLVQSGVDIYKVQRLLGHKNPIMTQRYAHHYPEFLRDGVEVLDKIRREYSTKIAQSIEVTQ